MFGSEKLSENGAAAQRIPIQSKVSSKRLSNMSKLQAKLSERALETRTAKTPLHIVLCGG